MKRMQTGRADGFAVLPTVLIMAMVMGVFLSAIMMRSNQAAMKIHRDLLHNQAQWLAQSAVERAVGEMSMDALPGDPHTSEWSRVELAPIFIESDPLKADPEGPRAVVLRAQYRYSASQVEGRQAGAWQEALEPAGTAGPIWMVTGEAAIDYRDTALQVAVRRVCAQTGGGQWVILPLR